MLLVVLLVTPLLAEGDIPGRAIAGDEKSGVLILLVDRGSLQRRCIAILGLLL